MASTNLSIYDYRYYIEGRKLAILQRSLTAVYDPFMAITDELYETPTVSDSSAIYIRYSIQPQIWSTTHSHQEAEALQLSQHLSNAVLYYVKSMLAEDTGKEKLAEYYKNKFYYYVSRHRKNLKGSASIVLPNYVGAVVKIN